MVFVKCIIDMLLYLVFVFKQKTAYEIEYGLVGSEMCIRDRHDKARGPSGPVRHRNGARKSVSKRRLLFRPQRICLLYTSDAADERSSVDLGGRRIIKKKNNKDTRDGRYTI